MLTPNIVPDFTDLGVAVVGDLIADHYVYAQPKRLSREAPVIVMRLGREEIRPGGTGNVARNVWSLGANARVLGAVGRDRNGREVISALQAEGIEVDGVETLPGWTTPTKTRVLGAQAQRTPRQVLRIDREPDEPVPIAARRAIAARLRELAGQIDVLIVSDYSYGVAGPEVAEAALELKQKGVTVVLDPRTDLQSFKGVTAITPNVGELAQLVGRRTDDLFTHAQLVEAAGEALAMLQPDFLLVTLGNRGMALFGRELPSEGVAVAASGADEVIDISGVGDTAVATFALGLAAGLEAPRAMRLANAAAGVVVMEHGTTACSLSKLRSALPLAPKPDGVETILT